MFTGIVQTTGTVGTIKPSTATGDDLRLRIVFDVDRLDTLHVGDSVSVNGVCLTASAVGDNAFDADVSAETLSCTTLGTLKQGSRVNLESAVTPSTALGGHLVSGHVDGVGEVTRRTPDAGSVRFEIRAPERLSRYIAPKGSITVDGVSLTVNAVSGSCFEVNIIPHTLDVTVIGDYRTGHSVNLEVDLIARYVERLLQFSAGAG